MRAPAHALIAVASLLVATAAFAQKRTVDIAFAIKEGNRYDNFDAANVKIIQDLVRNGLATKLSGPKGSKDDHGAFPLFDFWAQAAEHHLTIEVDDDKEALGIASPAILRLRMDADEFPDLPPLTIKFRVGHEDEPGGTAKNFAGDILKCLSSDLGNDRDKWVGVLFPEVVVAENVPPIPGTRSFKLPFSAAEYEIGDQSLFLVKTASLEFTTRPVVSEVPMQLAVGPSDTVPASNQLRPNTVRVKQYRRAIPRPKATPPSAANLTPGGS